MNKALTLLLVFLVTGCATMRQTTSSEAEAEQLRARISELEKELQNKDEDIWLLQREADKAYEVSSNRAAVSSSNITTTRIVLSTKQIQTALKKAGFYSGSIDGKIGKVTKKAIVAFQKANNLVADGVVGKKTAAKLNSYLQ